MARTPGATNRTPREIRKDAEYQLKLAKERERTAKLRQKLEEQKKKKSK